MRLSDCCGAETTIEKRADDPHVYDDEYNLQVNFLICTKCGKIIGLDSFLSD